MKTYRITELARAVGLSRSTLLHYDRIGLLAASDRSRADYRIYTEADRRRLERICQYRAAGLPLADIRALLDVRGRPAARLLEKRLRQTSEEIGALRGQQRLLASLLRVAGKKVPPTAPAPITGSTPSGTVGASNASANTAPPDCPSPISAPC